MLIPYKNPKALGSYYCGVFALIPVVGLILGPIAIILAILGIRAAKADPEIGGMAHAIVGIILGTLAVGYQLVILVVVGAASIARVLN